LFDDLHNATVALAAVPPVRRHGQIEAIRGTELTICGMEPWLKLGIRIEISATPPPRLAEIVGFQNGLGRALGFAPIHGIGAGDPAWLSEAATLAPCDAWLGRVLDPLGEPLDGRGALPRGPAPRASQVAAPSAATRARLGPRLDLGVRVLDAFATCRRGQRLGLFAASGVGKSTLLSMLAAGAECDVVVLALVGERGRELREFIEDDLGPAGLARSVVICATSDTSALMRREAAYAAMAVAEHFADRGRHVLLLMDSVTRFAMALREIGLAAGEPPTTRGYTPTVFAELPRLLERAGPRAEGCEGAITGLFTVLVEGDDHDEPVADAVRGILDGHVVLDRRIGEGGRYPAVDVLRSLSRTVPGCLAPDEWAVVREARAALALAAEMSDLVRLGAYRAGTDPAVDAALAALPRLEAVMAQTKGERTTAVAAFRALADALQHGA